MTLRHKIDALVAEYGEAAVLNEALSLSSTVRVSQVATIIANAGLHSFPDDILRGDVYEFSRGMMDLSSKSKIEETLAKNLRQLAGFLRAKQWKKIYIVTSGHPVFSMQIKVAVYRITRLETVDWLYDGTGNYFEISVPVRRLMAS